MVAFSARKAGYTLIHIFLTALLTVSFSSAPSVLFLHIGGSYTSMDRLGGTHDLTRTRVCMTNQDGKDLYSSCSCHRCFSLHRKLWTDDTIREPDWRRFIAKLLAQWESVILWSTVMLTANVGFLANPGVVLSNINGSNLTGTSQVTIFTSPTQIASCLSVQASIGSIVVGMPLLRRHLTKIQNDPRARQSTYLFLNTHRVFGLEPTAIVFSLPWALLMWSVATFYIALLLFCFTISNKATRISVAAMSIMMVVLVVWSIRALNSQLAGNVFVKNLAVLRRSRHRFLARFNRLFRTRAPTSQGSIQMAVRHIGVV